MFFSVTTSSPSFISASVFQTKLFALPLSFLLRTRKGWFEVAFIDW
ncbi:Uncharacterised protein [uncultured archaeon]|nr:Uncharacterised protein [uncultured archaeon]